MNITHPSITHQIRSLETELATKLFHRTARTVVLTSGGADFFAWCGALCRCGTSTVSNARTANPSLIWWSDARAMPDYRIYLPFSGVWPLNFQTFIPPEPFPGGICWIVWRMAAWAQPLDFVKKRIKKLLAVQGAEKVLTFQQKHDTQQNNVVHFWPPRKHKKARRWLQAYPISKRAFSQEY